VKYILRIEIESQEIHCFFPCFFIPSEIIKTYSNAIHHFNLNGGKNITMKYWSNLGIGWYQTSKIATIASSQSEHL
jgi:hypothetical protein